MYTLKENKKLFTDNHRKNYEIQNKSNIFDSESYVPKGRLTGKNKTKFIPQFKEESAFNRRLKEYGNKSKYDKNDAKTVSSVGFLCKDLEHTNNIKSPTSRTLTAKETKILELNPQLKEKVNDVIVPERPPFFNSSSLQVQFHPSKSCRNIKHDNLESNIFNDPVF
jgi:hypothetical protein